MAKQKLKTKRAAYKRFWKSTAKGKIRRGIRNHGHFLSKMGQKARRLAGTALVDDCNFNMIDRMLPMLRAKRKRTQALKRAAARQQQASQAAAK